MPWTYVISALNREEIVETFCEKELQKKKKKRKNRKEKSKRVYTLHKKRTFPLRILSVNVAKSIVSWDLVTFTGETFN